MSNFLSHCHIVISAQQGEQDTFFDDEVLSRAGPKRAWNAHCDEIFSSRNWEIPISAPQVTLFVAANWPLLTFMVVSGLLNGACDDCTGLQR